jgi:quercetin dioxygenase-like cupin family protein
MAVASLHRWQELTTDKPMALLERQRVIGEQMMVSRVTLHSGCKVPIHSHANEQISCILTGRLKFQVGEEARTIVVGPGEVLLLPAHVPHAAEALEETVVLDMFSPPSQTTGIDVHPASS